MTTSKSGRINEARRSIRTVVVFWGITSLVVALYLGFLAISTYFGPMVDGDIAVYAWEDLNGNGTMDEGEPPLPGVCVWYRWEPDPYVENPITGRIFDPCDPSDLTNDEGKWDSGFLAGGTCEDAFAFAEPPQGYSPTTNLGSHACGAHFGFVREATPVAHAVLSAQDFGTRETIRTAIVRGTLAMALLAFAGITTRWLTRDTPGSSDMQAREPSSRSRSA